VVATLELSALALCRACPLLPSLQLWLLYDGPCSAPSLFASLADAAIDNFSFFFFIYVPPFAALSGTPQGVPLFA